MGCCLSATKSSKAENHHHPSLDSCKNGGAPPQPPPSSPPVEEETVKEVVLSETTMPKLETLNVTEEIEKDDNKDSEVQVVGDEASVLVNHSLQTTELVKPNEEIMISEVSEYSEMCSFTESLSTTTAPEKRDDDDEVTQRSPARIPRRPRSSGDGNGKGPRQKGAISPGRRPAKERTQVTSSRASQGRQLTGQRRNVGPVNNLRRHSGEYPDRRSRSPATRGNGGMSQNLRQKSIDLSEKRPGGSSPARRVNKAGEGEKRADDVVQGSSESLENPVVSLECFIFL